MVFFASAQYSGSDRVWLLTLVKPELLDRSSEAGRVLFTRDDDLLAEGTQRQKQGIQFQGVIYAHQLRVSIGRCVQDLEIIAQAGEPKDLLNAILFLPL